MTGHAWDDNNYEGKLLRKAIGKLAKKLKETDDTEELIKIINSISTASNAKVGLAKYEHQDKKMDKILQLLENHKLVKYNDEAFRDAKELPGFKD